ncbi:MAG: hypothetical protein Q4P15_04775, partial [Propionibacteriaceae bacterium]|nr:hypothetical protein [Propionibacteriaceae bacterium]
GASLTARPKQPDTFGATRTTLFGIQFAVNLVFQAIKIRFELLSLPILPAAFEAYSPDQFHAIRCYS